MPKQIEHILVIRLSAMGDVAMTVPVIKALVEQNPKLKITVLTRELFLLFYRDLTNVSVYLADLKGIHRGVLGLYKLSKELKKLEIDAVADLHNVLRTSVLKFFISNKPFKQIDKGRKEKNKLVTGELFHQLKTTHQRYADVFSELGFTINLSNPTFPNPKELSVKIISLLGEQTKPIIGIAPFAQYESKMYPLGLMEDVIKALSSRYKILLFGGGETEINKLNELEAKHDSVINIAGKLELNDELDLISNLECMLSMDSGNAHIAAFLGIKVITVWGVTHPYAGFSPFNQPEDYALKANREKYPKIPTSIYGNKFPDNYINASGSISVNEIIGKIEKVLKEESLTAR